MIGDELNSLFSWSSVCFVCDSNWWMISPCPYLDPGAFHHISCPLSSWGRGVIERFWWAPGIYSGQTKARTHSFTCSLYTGALAPPYCNISLDWQSAFSVSCLLNRTTLVDQQHIPDLIKFFSVSKDHTINSKKHFLKIRFLLIFISLTIMHLLNLPYFIQKGN